MTVMEALGVAAAPVSAVAAWVISVEKRLGLIESIDKKVDLLLEHALEDKDDE